jgi:hypothetical protein
LATLQHNITTVLTQNLLASGDNVSDIKRMSIANVHASSTTKVDLFLNKGANNYYLLKNVEIPSGTTLILNEEDNIVFDNTSNGFSMRIKLATAVPVDVLITR